MIKKGMILAAGFGTRLRPLTYKVPKPLLEVAGRPVIEYSLMLLKNAGIEEVVINLHHLGSQIESYVGDGSRYDLKVSYSYETEILGTGGGVKKVESFFDGDPFVVVNGDVIIDVDLKDVIKKHFENESVATMVLRPLSDGEKYTPVKVLDDQVKGFGKGDAMYTGLQVLSSKMLELIPKEGFVDIISSAYNPIIDMGERVTAYVFDGYWSDIGTLERLEEASELISNGGILKNNIF